MEDYPLANCAKLGGAALPDARSQVAPPTSFTTELSDRLTSAIKMLYTANESASMARNRLFGAKSTAVGGVPEQSEAQSEAERVFLLVGELYRQAQILVETTADLNNRL